VAFKNCSVGFWKSESVRKCKQFCLTAFEERRKGKLVFNSFPFAQGAFQQLFNPAALHSLQMGK